MCIEFKNLKTLPFGTPFERLTPNENGLEPTLDANSSILDDAHAHLEYPFTTDAHGFKVASRDLCDAARTQGRACTPNVNRDRHLYRSAIH